MAPHQGARPGRGAGGHGVQQRDRRRAADEVEPVHQEAGGGRVHVGVDERRGDDGAPRSSTRARRAAPARRRRSRSR
ncbi:hypothetical protein BJF78_31425 [Pseudonocardia sp. CNS-139]|nr:hypothetical protein BJF78_31425 [Pseudonocardia sp. CNS-139]